MESLFIKLLNNSISAGWLVLAVLLARLLLKKGPKNLRCALWALVGREWNEIVKTPAYAFNCLSGVIIFPLIAGMMYMTLSSQGEMGEAMTALSEVIQMG